MSFKNQLQLVRKRNSYNAQGIRQNLMSIESVLGASMANTWLNGLGEGQLTRVEEQLSHFRGYTYAIIGTIAKRIANQKLKIATLDTKTHPGYVETNRGKLANEFYKKSFIPSCGKEVEESNAIILESHRILDAFEKPNKLQTQYVLMYSTICNLELTGMAFWLMFDEDETESGRPEIWSFPVSWFEPNHTEDQLFQSWYLRPEGFGTPFEIPAEKVVYFYYPDPQNPLKAKSPLSALAESVLSDESIEVSNRKAFENGCNPGLALIVGRPPEMGGGGPADDRPYLTTEQRQQIIAAVTAHYRGVLNADEPLILDGLIRDAKRINNTPREMDFLNSGQMTKQRLAQGWGVNTIVLGDFQNANRAAAVAADESFLDLVINPRITMLSQLMTMTIGDRWNTDGENLIVYLERAHTKDIEFELKEEQQLYGQGAISRNEIRARHGLELIQDGDTCFVPGVGEIPILKIEQPEAKNLISAPRLSGPNTQKTMAQLMGDRLQASAWVRQLMRLKYDYEHALRNHFINMGERLRHQASRRASSSTSITDLFLAEIVDEGEWLKELKQMSFPYLQKMALTGATLEWNIHTRKGYSLNEMMAKGWMDTFTNLPKKLADAVGGFVGKVLSMDYWNGMIDTTKNDLASGAKEAQEKGETGTRAIDIAVNKALSTTRAFTRADNISEGESVTATNGGQNTARRQLAEMGDVRQKKWWTMQDAKVRESHRKAHGQIVGINDHFSLENDDGTISLCEFPGDPTLPAGQKCRCRCTVISL